MNSTEPKEQNIVAESAELPAIVSRKEAIAKGLKRYFTGKPCSKGHISEKMVISYNCTRCTVLYDANRYSENREKVKAATSAYAKENRSKVALAAARWQQNNREIVNKKNRDYCNNNKEKCSARGKLYRSLNKHKATARISRWRVENKEAYLEIGKRWRTLNPLNSSVRKMLNRVIDNWKGRRAEAELALGYTYAQLSEHIENQFVDGMRWEMRSEWHIDHIKPVSLFLKEGETDPKIINALSNLQPLWAKDNLSKGAKYNE